jgi:DNA-binding NarL/FixJ family response regulator
MTVISPEIRRLLAEDPPIPVLTSRQTEVLQSMMRGLTNRDIAKQLGIRQDGVNEHVAAILAKIGAANRTEAVAIALRKHLLKL